LEEQETVHVAEDQTMQEMLGAVEAKMQQVLHSRSWRMTQPYRDFGDWIRGRLGWFR